MSVLLAVSGGIDSMCMADMFSHSCERYAIAHCNFHLRDKDSNADAELVRKWADSHGVRFFCADFDTAGYAAAKGISIEMAAREQRYAWFRFIAETQGFDAVATAHNANDNAETLILNLLRGTGSHGLRGISQISDLSWSQGTATEKEDIKLIRPLLGMSRADIERYAQEHGVQYREDRTNAESVYKRNRIRNIIFPEFEKINPSFIRTLNEDMDRFRQVDDIAEDYFTDNAGKVFDGTSVKVSALLGLRHWRYMLFRVLEPYGFSPQVQESIISLLEDIAAGSRKITFSGKRFESSAFILETSCDSFAVHKKTESEETGNISISCPGEYLFNGRKILVESIENKPGTNLRQEKGILICDAGRLRFPLTLRRWEPGDWMRPFGMGGRSKKLSDIFTDMKWSLSEKESAVIVHSPALAGDDASHVAAVAGYRMDEALRVTKGSENIIRISLL